MANTSGPQAPIGNKQTLNTDAAAHFNALVQEIKDATGIVIIPTEGTRQYARQKELYDGYIQGKIDPATGQRYNPAWSPDDPRAYHLSGRAVDVGSGVGYRSTEASKAFYARAGRYGFDANIPHEPWHFEWLKDNVSADINLEEDNELNAEEKKQLKDVSDKVEKILQAMGREEKRSAAFEKVLIGPKSDLAKMKAALGRLASKLLG